jgi:rSAM/selenodomain-associated transferase 1
VKDVLVVFARAPRLGVVKRRLAASVGERSALRFHQQTMGALLRAVAADRRFRTVLAITPDASRLRVSCGIGVLGQRHGDLGVRMNRVLRRFPRRRVAIIGCDIPDANAGDAAAAFRALGRAQAVFGPASDGGYWLVGVGPRRPAHPFRGVRWSSPHALTDTLRNFGRRPVAFLRTLDDVDTGVDWERLMARRAGKSSGTRKRENQC